MLAVFHSPTLETMQDNIRSKIGGIIEDFDPSEVISDRAGRRALRRDELLDLRAPPRRGGSQVRPLTESSSASSTAEASE